jgi:porphobilinogen synthase
MLNRPRRNRKSNSIRELVKETHILKEDFILPIFVEDTKNKITPIQSMPEYFRYSPDTAYKEIEESLELGINKFILFPQIKENKKDRFAKFSYNKNLFYLKFISSLKAKFPEATIITDVAMDPYSSDGHDGIVKEGIILNDETLTILGKMSLAQAEAGADIIGPSDMMDGRVLYLRNLLDQNGFKDVSIMSYSVKYASSFYGPFRDALNSAPKSGNKKTYQMDPANSKEAIMEAKLDDEEGADFLLVKPALHYLDIIYQLNQKFHKPIIAYHVSGEYSMLMLAIEKRFLNRRNAIEETLLSIKRSGAKGIITYLAKHYLKEIQNE